MGRKTKADPTGQLTNRDKSAKALRKQLFRAEGRIKKVFLNIGWQSRRQVKVVNEQTTVYDYNISEAELDALRVTIQRILNHEVMQTQLETPPQDWYYRENIELSHRQGALEEVRDFNGLVAGAIAAGVLINGLPPRTLEPQSILFSQRYRESLSTAYIDNFRSIKGMSDKTAADVMRAIKTGIRAGRKPSDVATGITNRFNVSKASAERIARTEINKAYTDAKMETSKVMAQQTGLRAGVIHISALTDTTRSEHAARHGNAYTVEDQQEWWDKGANRINCKCTVESVLIDDSGKVVDAKKQEEIKEERSFFS